MRIRLFTLQYSSTLGGFDDTCIRDFLRDKHLVSFREHFFTVHEVPHLLCVVGVQEEVVPTLTMATPMESASTLRTQARGDDDSSPYSSSESATLGSSHSNTRRGAPKDSSDLNLSESERILFNTLREWRSKKARDQGVPPYILFTNRQLAHIVRRTPETLNALSQIDGVGPAKIKQYGQAVLACLHGKSSSTKPLVPPVSAMSHAAPMSAATDSTGAGCTEAEVAWNPNPDAAPLDPLLVPDASTMAQTDGTTSPSP